MSAAYAALQDGRNVRFGEDGASSEATYNYGAYADEAELFRAMFAGDGLAADAPRSGLPREPLDAAGAPVGAAVARQ